MISQNFCSLIHKLIISEHKMKFCLPHVLIYFTDAEITKKLRELNNFYSNEFSDSENKLQNDKELQLITEILCKSSRYQLQSQNHYELVACTIKILLKYANIPVHIRTVLSKRKCKRRYQHAKNNYIKLLKIFITEKQGDIIKIIIDIINQEKFWQVKEVCVNIIKSLFEYGYNGSLVYHEICDKIEFSENSMEVDIKYIVKVLYKLFHTYNWPETEETVIFLKRFLNLYYKSLYNVSEELDKLPFTHLRSSLELCVRHIIQNTSNNHLLIIIQHMSSWSINENINDNVILNFGSTLEYAAYMHKGELLASILTSDILSLIMQMIKSNIRFVSLLGNRVLQHLIDRGKNIMLFNTPKIFFEDVKLTLRVNKYDKKDIKFLKEHREIIHESLINSFINHRHTRLNLETTYCTACLLAIEVPCGFTAAALSCLMINLQEIIIKKSDQIGKKTSYHIHAIIISVISFICWIHNAKDFHIYVNKVVMERAQWAPHLNPPLQSRYKFAGHHVLWNKSDLFLIDWEVRYGLWKRFRLKESIKSITTSISYKN